MRLNAGRYRGCYEKALRQRPHLNGRARLRFVIGRDGNVRSAAVAGLEHAPELSTCFQRATYGMTFPQPEGGIVTVSYPWVLRPLAITPPIAKYGHR